MNGQLNCNCIFQFKIWIIEEATNLSLEVVRNAATRFSNLRHAAPALRMCDKLKCPFIYEQINTDFIIINSDSLAIKSNITMQALSWIQSDRIQI